MKGNVTTGGLLLWAFCRAPLRLVTSSSRMLQRTVFSTTAVSTVQVPNIAPMHKFSPIRLNAVAFCRHVTVTGTSVIPPKIVRAISAQYLAS